VAKKNKNKARKQSTEFSNELSRFESNEEQQQQQNKKSKQDRNC